LATGYVALDTMLPIVEGQRMGIFAGSGVGKSHLLGNLAREMEADIVVAVMVGERGREVAAFARDVLGRDRMGRAVIVAATSDRPANVRRRALPAGLTVAEYFRNKGARVLFLCDSLTRHAEAYRDVIGDGASGLPVGLVSDIAASVERVGPGAGGQKAITAVFSVLVAGSNMEEPIADMVRGLLDGHVILSREIAEAGRYPAIDVLASTSRSLPDCATPVENALIKRTRALLEVYSRNELMISSGLYESGNDARIDEAIDKRQALETVLCARAGQVSESFELVKKVIS
jgi:flagellum-specific ATP synthase